MDFVARASMVPLRQRTQYTCTANKGVDWDKAPLGQMSDGVIARMYGVARPVVCNARNRRGIPPFTPRRAPVDWSQTPLGEFPDALLAENLGVSQPTVTRHRNQRGIPPFKATFLTTEGEPADSYPEALIDLYWHEQGVPHQFQVKIGNYIADWVINEDTVVEYAGFVNHPKFGNEYWTRLKTKVAFYKEQGWKVEILRPSDLNTYYTGTPPRFRDQSCCSGCGRRFGSRGGSRGGKVRRATSFLCDPCWRAAS